MVLPAVTTSLQRHDGRQQGAGPRADSRRRYGVGRLRQRYLSRYLSMYLREHPVAVLGQRASASTAVQRWEAWHWSQVLLRVASG